MTTIRVTASILLLASVAGCTVGPDFTPPTAEAPPAWKGESAADIANIPAEWWTLFGDAKLTELVQTSLTGNQDLAGALARVEQARAAARFVGADRFPRVSGGASWERQRYSENRSVAPGARGGSYTGSSYNIPFDVSYEIDLWGRVRRNIEAATAAADANELDREGLRLTVAGEVARTYFAIRSLDAEARVLADAVDLRKKAMEIVRGRFDAGVGNEVDLSRAQTELATAEADLRGVRRQRAALENALAVLCGVAPSGFTLDATTDDAPQLAVPAGLPSDLLRRRPDIAASVERMRESNARIGVVKAAYFPTFTLTGSVGFVSGELQSALDAGSRVWSFSPAVRVPIFEGGRYDARMEQARAELAERDASYRQTLLIAFREVEDSLSALGELKGEIAFQSDAQKSADRTFELASGRYRQGLVTYLEVVDAARTQLDSRRARIRLLGVETEQTVLLIKALGGGWTRPDPATTPTTDPAPEASPEPTPEVAKSN